VDVDNGQASLRLTDEALRATLTPTATQVVITIVTVPDTLSPKLIVGNASSKGTSSSAGSSSSSTTDGGGNDQSGDTDTQVASDPGQQTANTWLVVDAIPWAQWTTSSLPSGLTAAVASDLKKVAAVAGFGGSVSMTGALLDLATHSWTNFDFGSNPGVDGPAPRKPGILLPLTSNRFLLFGGSSLTTAFVYRDDAWIFNSESGEWTELPQPPLGSGEVADGACTISRSAGREIIIIGVTGGSYDGRSAILDTTTNTWKAVASQSGLQGATIICNPDTGMVYGLIFDSPSKIFTLDTRATNPAWSTGAATDLSCCNTNLSQFGMRASAFADNKLLIAFTQANSNNPSLPQAKILTYNLLSSSWSVNDFSPESSLRVNGPTSFYLNDHFFFVTGVKADMSGEASNLVVSFNRLNGTWQTHATSPTPKRMGHSFVVTTDKRAIFAGGTVQPSNSLSNEPWLFQPGD
jgi:V8-like Glu-specific endopeptidase